MGNRLRHVKRLCRWFSEKPKRMLELALISLVALAVAFWACFFHCVQRQVTVLDSEICNAESCGERGSIMTPTVFPDVPTCRVKRGEGHNQFDCLNRWAAHCPFALQAVHGYVCRHPTNAEILARTGLPS